MAQFRLQVVLPDRPGSLGAVASAIGFAGGDEIERGRVWGGISRSNWLAGAWGKVGGTRFIRKFG